jgi:hypothetical protein
MGTLKGSQMAPFFIIKFDKLIHFSIILNMSEIPDWLKNLKNGDEILLVYPFTGNSHYAEIMVYNIFLDKPNSIKVSYKNTNNIEEVVVLHFSDYSTESSHSYNWFAYQLD